MLIPKSSTPTRARTVVEVFYRLRVEVRNWLVAGLLAAVVMPTRVPPRRGLAGTWFGSRVITFRMRDGSNVTCRLQDAGDLISVYLDQDYAPFDIPWHEVNSLIDVGATVGCFTLWALKRATHAMAVAVEPNPNVYPFLCMNVAANGLAHRVRTISSALGSKTGYGQVVDRTFSTFATVVPESTASLSSVPILTLGQLIAQVGIEECDLLKLDCEGSEYEILLGCDDEVLSRIRAIVCEFHPMPGHSVDDLANRLISAGFTLQVSGGPIGFVYARR
jgi:FkbM family methyltransferase